MVKDKFKENIMEDNTLEEILLVAELKIDISNYSLENKDLWNSCVIIEEEL